MTNETIDALTRRPGERYFTYIKRCRQNEEARQFKLLELERDINIYTTSLPKNWSNLCRAAKAYGILLSEWRYSKR